jgi:hypothetical protein
MGDQAPDLAFNRNCRFMNSLERSGARKYLSASRAQLTRKQHIADAQEKLIE